MKGNMTLQEMSQRMKEICMRSGETKLPEIGNH